MKMNKNILIINGSPKGKGGNSESIANYLFEKLNEKKLTCSKSNLSNIINKEDTFIEDIDSSYIVILVLPVYENSVPGLVIKFFEQIYKNKFRLVEKQRKLLVITNSGFPEVEANRSAINTCRLFCRDMGFIWMGGIAAAPGTLIDGKKLHEAGKTYNRLIQFIDLVSETILKGEEIPLKHFEIMNKPFINPFIYRIGGKMMQKSVIKKLGKDKFLAKPLEI